MIELPSYRLGEAKWIMLVSQAVRQKPESS